VGFEPGTFNVADASRRGSPITVLVVDDYAEMRGLIRVAFELAEGFEVVAEAGSVDEALDAAGRTRPDAVVLDVLMPGRSPLDSLDDLAAAAGDPCAIVLLTALPDDAIADLAAGLPPGFPVVSKAQLPILPDVVTELCANA